MNKRKKLLDILGLFVIALLVALAVTWLTLSEQDKEGLQQNVFQTQEDDAGDEQRRIDWDSLPENVVAWVKVPGTNIDEPIVRATPEAPNAFLYVDALGRGSYGTPYLDCDCTFESPLVMIYGHHMSDGSQFADFANFIEPEYAEEHDLIILYLREGETLYLKPCAVDIVNASRERLNLSAPDLKNLIASSDLILNTLDEQQQLYAFATCSYQTWNSRTIVYARFQSI